MLKTVSIMISVFALAFPVLAASPATGETAPDFSLQDQGGRWHSLEDYRGNWVALYFYPKDDTPGCTAQACAFRDDIFKFRQRGIKIIGISLDDSESHANFAAKHKLPFALLADTDHVAASAYGVLGKFGLFTIAKRQSFLIDPDGRIAVHYKNVDAASNAGKMLADADRLIEESRQ